MMKPTLFKQQTPNDQLEVIQSAIEGHMSNFEDGTIDEAKLRSGFDEYIKNVELLRPFLKQGHW